MTKFPSTLVLLSSSPSKFDNVGDGDGDVGGELDGDGDFDPKLPSSKSQPSQPSLAELPPPPPPPMYNDKNVLISGVRLDMRAAAPNNMVPHCNAVAAL